MRARTVTWKSESAFCSMTSVSEYVIQEKAVGESQTIGGPVGWIMSHHGEASCRFKWRSRWACTVLTFYEFPKSMWKALRSTNNLENLNREFRRRTKTQASFPTEEAAVALLFALVAFGQIRMRKLDGYQELPAAIEALRNQAA